MIKLGPTTVSSGQGDRDRRKSRRSSRNRLIPGAESLEVRDCPSAMAPQLGLERSAQAPRGQGSSRGASPSRRGEPAPCPAPQGRTLKKSAKGAPGTIYVTPTGKTGATAGKTAARPLGSLTLAIKRAKPGSTIYLAPGTYTQNVVINGKSNLTIIGAANGSSVITAPGAIKAGGLLVNASSNVTINNVSFHETTNGVAGLAIVGFHGDRLEYLDQWHVWRWRARGPGRGAHRRQQPLRPGTDRVGAGAPTGLVGDDHQLHVRW